MNLVAAKWVFSWRSLWHVCVSGLCCCDERTRVNACVNKSLFQALQSSPVVLLVSHRLNCIADIFSVFSTYYFTFFHPTCCSANHSTFSRGNLPSAGIANAYMDSHKLDTILRKPFSVHCFYSSASVPKWPQKKSQSI